MTDAVNTNRADQLRQRRAQDSQERARASAQRVTTPLRSKPVTQRRDTAPRSSQNFRTIPVAQKSRSKPRRQFYYTLSGTGAEVRLPAIPMVKLGPRLFSGILALVLFIALFSMLGSSTFKVGAINVVGLQRVSSEEIASVMNMTDESIFAFDQAAATTQLARAFPELKDLSIDVKFPAAITVTAIERTPILTWAYDDKTLWLDSEGVLFPVRGEVEGLPAIQGDTFPPLLPALAVQADETDEAFLNTLLSDDSASILGRTMEPAVLETTLRMLPQIPEDATLVYSRHSGLGWNDANGWKVYIGRSLEDIDIKMVEYQTIVSYLGSQGVQPSEISVESIHAPFFRTEQ